MAHAKGVGGSKGKDGKTTAAAGTDQDSPSGEVHTLESVAILFAGDSGDGMQLTGAQFSTTAAIVGNDISTLPSFPAEIRAPAGTLPGVSGYQVRIGSTDIFTPGDRPRVLVAMNLGALRASYNLGVITEQFQFHYRVPKAAAAPGTYRAITGNEYPSSSGARPPASAGTLCA